MRAKLIFWVVFSFLLFCFVTPTIGQIYTPSKIKDYLTLSDKVHILSFFIETEDGEWTDEEVDSYYTELLKSQRWLENEANKWNQNLTFDNEYFFMEDKSIIHLKKAYFKSNSKLIIQKIVQELNYLSFPDFLDQNEFDLEKEKLKLVIFVKGQNRSHAYNAWSKDDMDLAVIYCNDNSSMDSDHYVISHEILHQFGAWDLYYERGRSQTEKSGKIALEKYPHSIMINTHINKEQLMIDEVTAWRIGWSEWKESFNEFDPFLNQERIKEEAFKNRKNAKVYKYTIGSKKKAHN